MIVLLLVARNESYYLRLNIEHHLSWGFDHIGVADNESDDDTVDVCHEYRDYVTRYPFQRFPRFALPGNLYEEKGIARQELLERIFVCFGRVEWVCISDPDEFWFLPDVRAKELLADIPSDVASVTFDQKLFLPTELDGTEGSLLVQRVFCSSGAESPLHTSYKEGKSFYRGSWLRGRVGRVASHDHWLGYGLGSDPFRSSLRPLHHYMFRGEDHFVEKVKNFERSRTGGQLPPHMLTRHKGAWRQIYAEAGEDGLRSYFRQHYVIPANEVQGHLRDGNLVRDETFAQHRRSVELGGHATSNSRREAHAEPARRGRRPPAGVDAHGRQP
jgi:hypothetical protein